jgi:ketosteroid isomerase-like protein
MHNRDIVQSIYSAAETGDITAIERVLADDVVLFEPPHHPAVLGDTRETPGVWRGRADVVDGITKVFTALRLAGVELETIVADGDRAVGLLTVLGSDHTSQPYSMRMAEVFTLSEGKVTAIRAFYFDTAELCTHAGVALSS